MRQRGHFLEGCDRFNDAIDDALRRNGERELTFLARTVYMQNARSRTGAACRMQHTEADTVADERGARYSLYLEVNDAVGAAGDLCLPREIDIAFPIFDVIADHKIRVADLHLDVR
ncbi:MAG: hypothetical protein ACK47M_00770 [Caldilinea sp.]